MKINHQSIAPEEQDIGGFSLLEISVVLAILAMLSSIAIPNITKIATHNNIDEIKALLNTAAADCLQKSRLSDPAEKDQIDKTILPALKLNELGYKINTDDGSDKCSYLQLIRASTDDEFRYNIGFSVSDGRLTKFANQMSSPNDQSWKKSCIRWDGECKENKDLKDLNDYKKTVAAAEASCKATLAVWASKDGGKMKPTQTTTWDSASSQCPTKVPRDSSGNATYVYKTDGSCSTSGCTKSIWGLWDKDTDTGSTYTSENSYEVARLALVGVKCAKQIKDNYEDLNESTTINGIPMTECNDEVYWFFEGNNAGSKVEWEKLNYKANNPTGKQTLSDESELYLCLGEEKATEELMTKCINDNEKAGCENKITKRIASKENGYFKAQDSGAIPCTNEYWFCDGSNKGSEDAYNESACGRKSCPPQPEDFCIYKYFIKTRQVCKDWATCEGIEGI